MISHCIPYSKSRISAKRQIEKVGEKLQAGFPDIAIRGGMYAARRSFSFLPNFPP